MSGLVLKTHPFGKGFYCDSTQLAFLGLNPNMNPKAEPRRYGCTWQTDVTGETRGRGRPRLREDLRADLGHAHHGAFLPQRTAPVTPCAHHLRARVKLCFHRDLVL
jgi:hypothetical protein